MESCLRTPVKELIARHPAVGEILEEYGVGCVPCAVGTCLLGEIVEIHGLSCNDERHLLTRVLAAIAPGRAVVLPATRKDRAARPRSIAYSPPMKRLVAEHEIIKRFIALVPDIISGLDLETEEGRRVVLEGVDFIRSYADRFHHAKEEDLLFGRFDQGLEVIKAMREDHVRGRARAAETLEALERGDKEGVARALKGYAEILTDHIRKEDEILYPWMDRNLSTRQVGELYSAFMDVDDLFAEKANAYKMFVADLEEKLHVRKEAVR